MLNLWKLGGRQGPGTHFGHFPTGSLRSGCGEMCRGEARGERAVSHLQLQRAPPGRRSVGGSVPPGVARHGGQIPGPDTLGRMASGQERGSDAPRERGEGVLHTGPMETRSTQLLLRGQHWCRLPKASCVILKPAFEGSDLLPANGGPAGRSSARGHRLMGWGL